MVMWISTEMMVADASGVVGSYFFVVAKFKFVVDRIWSL